MTAAPGEETIRRTVAGLSPAALSQLATRLGLLPLAEPADRSPAGNGGPAPAPGGATAAAAPPPDLEAVVDGLPDSEVDSLVERLLGEDESPPVDRPPPDGSDRSRVDPDADLVRIAPSELDAVLAVLLAETGGGAGVGGAGDNGSDHRRGDREGLGVTDVAGGGRRAVGGDDWADIRHAVDDLARARAACHESDDPGDPWARFVAAVGAAWGRFRTDPLTPAAAVQLGTLLVTAGVHGGAGANDVFRSRRREDDGP